MAESFAAHLTSAQSIGSRPSIFEVLANETLSSGLRNAANYLFKVLYQNNPQRYSRLYFNFDELYLLFDLMVQYSHLRAFSASFSENFYGLKRVSSHESRITDRITARLSSRELYSSLLLLIGVPYLRHKMDTLFERLKLTQMEGRIRKESEPIQCLFVYVYPSLVSLWDMTNLIYQLTYSVGRERYHSPLMHLLSLQLRCLTQSDINSRSAGIEIIEPNLNMYKYFGRVSWLFSKWLAAGLGAGLSLGAFFIQFLDYWYTRESSPPKFAPLPVPPPPERYAIEMSNDSCPLCHEKRRNDTALSSSGFVFCYSCIRSYILSHSRCPMTGYPSSCSHLVKLYPPDR